MPTPERLHHVLTGLRERGAIGTTSISDAVAHADRFVALLPLGPLRLADLGSGGGLPGLVIAVRRPDVTVVLVERRLARADQLRRAVAALDVGATVSVHAGDVRELAAAEPAGFAVVTARSFAAPQITAQWGAALLQSGGLLLVSEPPVDDIDRWPAPLLDACGFVNDGVHAGIRRLLRR